jgi:ribosomal-protein-alanine N-acetyltransferase
MLFTYETERLFLRVLGSEDADRILDFYVKGKDTFMMWEAKNPASFYTLSYQKRLLKAEMKQFITGVGARYYVFLKEDPAEIIGTVSLQGINIAEEGYCRMGYRLLREFQGQGYMSEAVRRMLRVAVENYELRKIEADIMPENEASVRFAKKMGFKRSEGIVKSYNINGKQEEHDCYILEIGGDI